MKPVKSGIAEPRTAVVPAGRDSYSQDRSKVGREAATTGLKRAGTGQNCRIRPLKGAAARLGPPSPAFAHINFFGRAKSKPPCRRPWLRWGLRCHGARPASRLEGEITWKSYGLFRIFPRSFTIFRTDQARKSSMFGFPSPPRDGCRKWVVRLRETWSHCYGWEPFWDREGMNEENRNEKKRGANL